MNVNIDKHKAELNVEYAFNYALGELFRDSLKDKEGKKVVTYEQLFNTIIYLANKYVFKNSKIVSSNPIFMRFLKIYEIYYLIDVLIIKNDLLREFIKSHGGFNDDDILKSVLDKMPKTTANQIHKIISKQKSLDVIRQNDLRSVDSVSQKHCNTGQEHLNSKGHSDLENKDLISDEHFNLEQTQNMDKMSLF